MFAIHEVKHRAYPPQLGFMERGFGEFEIPLIGEKLSHPELQVRKVAYIHLLELCSDARRVEGMVHHGLMGKLLAAIATEQVEDVELACVMSLLTRLVVHRVCQSHLYTSTSMLSLLKIFVDRSRRSLARITAASLLLELSHQSTHSDSIRIQLVHGCCNVLREPDTVLRDPSVELLTSICHRQPSSVFPLSVQIRNETIPLVLELRPIGDAQMEFLAAASENADVRNIIAEELLKDRTIVGSTPRSVSWWKLMSGVTTHVAFKIFFASTMDQVTVNAFMLENDITLSTYILLVLLNLSECPSFRDSLKETPEFALKLKSLQTHPDTLISRYSSTLDRDVFFLP
jgi:hypothetical protein